MMDAMTLPLTGPDVPIAVRTDDARFENLPGYPFAPHYVDVTHPVADGTLRMHYIDEGPSDAPVILMVHGEPAWSYLYRKLVPVFVEAGFRAIAVDQIGFGRSDKLTFAPHYSFERHVEWLRELVVALDLRDITLVCQDWGGPVGMAVLARETERFSRVAAGNTMLHTAESGLEGRLAWSAHASGEEDSTVSNLLLDWCRESHRTAEFDASPSIAFATARAISTEVVAAYDAPFPSEWHKAGMRHFPLLIPVTKTDPGAVVNQATWAALADFERPFLTIFGDSDPSTSGWAEIFRERVPGARAQPHCVLERAGHFWQEDAGAEAAELIVGWIRETSSD
jgi:haloalkane dehalogenase